MGAPRPGNTADTRLSLYLHYLQNRQTSAASPPAASGWRWRGRVMAFIQQYFRQRVTLVTIDIARHLNITRYLIDITRYYLDMTWYQRCLCVCVLVLEPISAPAHARIHSSRSTVLCSLLSGRRSNKILAGSKQESWHSNIDGDDAHFLHRNIVFADNSAHANNVVQMSVARVRLTAACGVLCGQQHRRPLYPASDGMTPCAESEM